jgi:isopentenyl-diphosphate Delta-isomerase
LNLSNDKIIGMSDELIDQVDENDEIIGSIFKSQAHQNPSLIHREVAIVVFNKKGEVLLQQRSMKKMNDPGHWKMTAAGHIGAGEDPEEAIKREVEEELGIKVEPTYYKKVFEKYRDKEARFFWIYYTVLSKEQPLKLDKEEVMDAKWVKYSGLKEFSKNNKYLLSSPSHTRITEVAEILDFT